MKKVIYLVISLILIGKAVSAQVSDTKVIPVAITLESILRLNVVTGGNIEFVVNTIDAYTNGIQNASQYDTRITVASSRHWNLDMYPDDPNDINGVDNATPNTMSTNNVAFWITFNCATCTEGNAAADNWNIIAGPTEAEMRNLNEVAGSNMVIQGENRQSAGDISQNDFTIHWELATADVMTHTSLGQNLLSQNLASDRYLTNVTIDLQAGP